MATKKTRQYQFRLKAWQRNHVDEVVQHRIDQGEEDVSRLSVIDEIFEKDKLSWDYNKHLKSLNFPARPEEPQEDQLETGEENPLEPVPTEEE